MQLHKYCQPSNEPFLLFFHFFLCSFQASNYAILNSFVVCGCSTFALWLDSITVSLFIWIVLKSNLHCIYANMQNIHFPLVLPLNSSDMYLRVWMLYPVKVIRSQTALQNQNGNDNTTLRQAGKNWSKLVIRIVTTFPMSIESQTTILYLWRFKCLW